MRFNQRYEIPHILRHVIFKNKRLKQLLLID